MTQDKIAIFNAGVNGHNVVELLQRLERDCLSNQPEVVILMIGTNDMLNEDKLLSLNEYRKHYQKLIELIKSKAKLFIMTIPPVNDEYIINRQPPEMYRDESPSAKVNAANTVIRELASQNDCHLIDLHDILKKHGGSTAAKDSLFQNEANFGIADGVHPTADGYKVIGEAVYQAVGKLEPGVKTIVCFGDSITYGYKMEGEGTIVGDSYPAILNKYFNQNN